MLNEKIIELLKVKHRLLTDVREIINSMDELEKQIEQVYGEETLPYSIKLHEITQNSIKLMDELFKCSKEIRSIENNEKILNLHDEYLSCLEKEDYLGCKEKIEKLNIYE
jgi:uncharacterized protein YdcH (DUF465 family)